jgi:uncharacterized Tic20 family protein
MYQAGERPIMDPMQPSKEERTWAMFAHLAGPVAGLLSAGVLVFLGPLIIWLVKKDESEFVDDQGKESVNFQFTILILYVAAWAATLASCGVLFPVIFAPFVLQVVLGIMAAVKSNDGQWYRYPINIRFIR